ncbi:dihydrolipoyllysine-residue acetyltransferase [Aquisalimonas sp. 2447]|uniref:2-oxo acid dehydrogenase subunit E2 n=1 Tax=Aquisalimonas sp. 2447 TaxID=2740807 RepID=UPI0014327EEA|nr:2-oxo acid dehydrogenase subunit E2 [Aquisalimonas sp. 2447]QIT55496.1 dihydrolipoyllysine-residue acetyltransferase [Aquisalimonas sp. 2447]
MTDFILPDIGEGIVECELTKWLVREGDVVAEDQPVVEVMTDKALVEIPAPEQGRITRLYYSEGEIARVHEPLFAYDTGEGEDDKAPPAGPQPEQEDESRTESAPAPPAEPARATPEQAEPVATPVATAPGGPGRLRTPATPAVRRMVREHGLRLDDIRGSGKHGRVLKADVLAHLDETTAGDRREEPDTAPAAGPAPSPGEMRVEPIKGTRAAMAKHMAHAAATVPHFIYGEEIDVTDLIALRERLRPEAEAQGVRLTLMPFFMKALAVATSDYPLLNSRVNDAVTEIHYQPHCNIGMAVDSEAGLVVPNVKQVEQRTLLEIATEVARLVEAARAGRVTRQDLQGGTITLSNIGALGGTYAAPIINAPEVAIAALGRTQYLPRFDAEDRVVKRAILPVSWAGDHRIIDGGTMARFCNRWKRLLESPDAMLLHLR